MESTELHQHEYTAICDVYKHYSNLRFAVLTLMLATNGGLFTLLTDQYTPQIHQIAQVAGLAIGVVFAIYHEVIVMSQMAFAERLRTLEGLLAYAAFTSRATTKRTLMSFRFATRGLLALSLLSWLVLLLAV